MNKKIFVFIIILLLFSNEDKTFTKKNEVDEILFGMDELSDLKDYISVCKKTYFLDCDSCYCSWFLFNRIKFSGLTVFPIDSTCKNLEFFAINEECKNIAIYYKDSFFYVYKLNLNLYIDSVSIIIE